MAPYMCQIGVSIKCVISSNLIVKIYLITNEIQRAHALKRSKTPTAAFLRCQAADGLDSASNLAVETWG